MDPNFKELFTFTSGEKRGLLVLTGIIILLLLTFWLLPFIINTSETSRSEWIKVMSSLDLKQNEPNSYGSDSILSTEDVKPERQLFEFDPNHATEKDFKALGLASWQIKIIEKYRNKGGVFRKAEDFSKIYGIDTVQFKTLEPFIHINSNQSQVNRENVQIFKSDKRPQYSNKKFSLEINSCDSTELDKINGIGKSLAARIVKYRNRLGGFARLEQMLEVYGVRAEIFPVLLSSLTLDTNLIHRLKINTIDYKELRKHPYLNSFQAGGIIKFRELKGKIKGVEDIKNNNLLSEDVLIKILPYLSFE